MSKEAPKSLFKEGVKKRHDDGSFKPAAIDQSTLADQFGLRVDDVKKEVTNGTYNGTVAEMLSDCPHVGAPIRDAFQKTGIDGVVQVFQGLRFLGVEADISEDTIKLNREGTLMEAVEQNIAQDQKKNRSQSQTQVFPQKFL